MPLKLKADNKLITTCYDLIKLHDIKTEITRPEMKKLLNKYGYETIDLLCKVKLGDALSHAEPYATARKVTVEAFSALATSVEESGECYTLKMLNINGNDLKARGYKGESIKEKLNFLLNEVIFERVKNQKEELLKLL